MAAYSSNCLGVADEFAEIAFSLDGSKMMVAEGRQGLAERSARQPPVALILIRSSRRPKLLGAYPIRRVPTVRAGASLKRLGCTLAGAYLRSLRKYLSDD